MGHSVHKLMGGRLLGRVEKSPYTRSCARAAGMVFGDLGTDSFGHDMKSVSGLATFD